MKCSYCGEHTPDRWLRLIRNFGEFTTPEQPQALVETETGKSHPRTLELDWMRCANSECLEVVIRVHEVTRRFVGGVPQREVTTYVARPRGGGPTRTVDALVDERTKRDYLEAASILDTSPRMSAVLSRRILADLLRTYAGKNQKNLADQIDSFIKDVGQPRAIRENLHHVREAADFGAHTQKGPDAEIIDVDRDQAEWTLDVLDRLFDYFIISPRRDEAMRARMDEKITKAGRTPIKPLPDAKSS